MSKYRRYMIKWYVGVREKKEGLLEAGRFNILSNPWNGWIADPFLFEQDGKSYIFAERWDYFKQKGSICCGIYEERKKVKWFDVIEEEFHLSYPLIWKDQNGIHICAETSERDEVYVYTAVNFPNEWKKDYVLCKGKFADSTLFFEKEEPKYIFTYLLGITGGRLLRGTIINGAIDRCSWKYITKDPKIARPGGNFVLREGRIYRIAQDCSENYGKGIVICEVESCSNSNYKERIICERRFDDFNIKTKGQIIGMHTYNTSTRYEIVDFRCKKFSLLNFLGQKKYEIVNILGMLKNA